MYRNAVLTAILVLVPASGLLALPPGGWTASKTIGGGMQGSAASPSPGVFTVTADGRDIWNNWDQFHYLYKELYGDGAVIARVTSRGTGANSWAKGGVMIRENDARQSKHAMMVLTGGSGGGASFQYRTSTWGWMKGQHTLPGSPYAPPYWVKVERVGNQFKGYLSPDGVTWTHAGNTTTINMSDPVLIGLCATSHATWQLRTFTFDSVSFQGYVSGEGIVVPMLPKPKDGTTINSYQTTLSWAPGEKAVTHEVYLSTDFNDVNDAMPAALLGSTGKTQVLVGQPNSYLHPDYLIPGETYFWRVAEVNDTEPNSPWMGDVWSFTVSASVDLPVVPEVEAWTREVKDASVRLVARVLDDGNDLCTSSLQLRSELDANWRTVETQPGLATGDVSTTVATGLIPGTNYTYRAVLANTDGARTSELIPFKTTGQRPVMFIYEQPGLLRRNPGDTARFTVKVAAPADAALLYRWTKDVPGGVPVEVGERAATLVLSDVQEADEGTYSCTVFSLKYGFVKADPATLIIKRRVGYWKMNGDLTDSSGHGWNAVYSRAGDPTFKSGVLGEAFKCHRADRTYAVVPGSEEAFNFYDEGFTASVWFRTVNMGYWNWSNLVSKQERGSPWKGWVLNTSPWGDIEFSLRSSTGFRVGPNLYDDNWHHVVASYNPAGPDPEMRVYIDGEMKTIRKVSRRPLLHNKPFVIGAETNTGIQTFEGLIDEVSLFNYAVTDHQALDLFRDVDWGRLSE